MEKWKLQKKNGKDIHFNANISLRDIYEKMKEIIHDNSKKLIKILVEKLQQDSTCWSGGCAVLA